MQVYFAHSFGSLDDTKPLRLSADPSILRFLSDATSMGAKIIDPAEVPIAQDMALARFEYCLEQILKSQALVVDARARVGLGVGAEMMYAHLKGIEVYVVAPHGSYYRPRTNDEADQVHAFIAGLANAVFADFNGCIGQLKKVKRGIHDVRRGL